MSPQCRAERTDVWDLARAPAGPSGRKKDSPPAFLGPVWRGLSGAHRGDSGKTILLLCPLHEKPPVLERTLSEQ